MKRLFDSSKTFISSRPFVAGAIGVAALFFIWVFFLRGGGEPSLQTLVVQRGDFLQQVAVAGTVVAAQDVDLGFAQSGRIAGIYAKVGHYVPAGTTLAAVENGDLRAAVLQKQAALSVEEAKLAALKAGTRPEQIAVTAAEVANNRVALLN